MFYMQPPSLRQTLLKKDPPPLKVLEGCIVLVAWITFLRTPPAQSKPKRQHQRAKCTTASCETTTSKGKERVFSWRLAPNQRITCIRCMRHFQKPPLN